MMSLKSAGLMTLILVCAAGTCLRSAGAEEVAQGMMERTGPGAASGRAEKGAENLADMKSRMLQMHQRMQAEKQQRRAAMDALDQKCFGAMQSAASGEAMRATREQCRAERQAMRDKFKEERPRMAARQGRHSEPVAE